MTDLPALTGRSFQWRPALASKVDLIITDMIMPDGTGGCLMDFACSPAVALGGRRRRCNA